MNSQAYGGMYHSPHVELGSCAEVRPNVELL
jgi:hypothetical protein